MKYKHMAIRPSRRAKPKIIHSHAQHGQSAFNPNAGIKSNLPTGIALVAVVVVQTICGGSGGGSGDTCTDIRKKEQQLQCDYILYTVLELQQVVELYDQA